MNGSVLDLATFPTRDTAHVSVASFDYSALPDASRNDAREAANRIKARVWSSYVETGKDLLAVKAAIGHGAFCQWIKAELRLTNRTVESYMNAARFLAGKCETLSYLPPTLIYALAAPSAPAAVVDDVVAAAEAGALPAPAAIRATLHAAIKADKLAKIEAAKSPEQIKKEKIARVSKQQREARLQAEQQRQREERHQLEREIEELRAPLAARIVAQLAPEDLVALVDVIGVRGRSLHTDILWKHLNKKVLQIQIAADFDWEIAR